VTAAKASDRNGVRATSPSVPFASPPNAPDVAKQRGQFASKQKDKELCLEQRVSEPRLLRNSMASATMSTGTIWAAVP